jgi:hypothetical protein
VLAVAGKSNKPVKNSELKWAAAGFRNGILAGRSSENFCYMVSSALAGYLQAVGVECSMQEGFVGSNQCHHWWIKLSDGRIVDATADQFFVSKKRLPKVIVGEMPEFYREIVT